MTVYPGDRIPRFDRKDNGHYLVTDLMLSTHTGTHIDAPSHYLKNEQTIDKIRLGPLIGECQVVNVTGVTGEIRVSDIKDRLKGVKRLLLRTGYQDGGDFNPCYTSPGLDAAREFSRQGITCLGTDAPSIEKFKGSGDVHRELLGKGILIIEFLDLHHVREGTYRMIALPLRLKGLDGSPARVILCPVDPRGKKPIRMTGKNHYEDP